MEPKKRKPFISREEGAKPRRQRKETPSHRFAINAKLGALASRKDADKVAEAKKILLEMKSLLKNKRLANIKAFSFFDNQLLSMVTDALNALK